MSGKAITAREYRTLLPADRDRLAECEETIERGRGTFLEVGRALQEVRDGRLYRETHATFEDYCRERWDFHRAQAFRMIEASSVVANLSPIGDVLPTNEAQARPLSRLEPEEQREAWQKAQELAGGEQPTAAQVQQAADEVKPPKKERTPAPRQAPCPCCGGKGHVSKAQQEEYEQVRALLIERRSEMPGYVPGVPGKVRPAVGSSPSSLLRFARGGTFGSGKGARD